MNPQQLIKEKIYIEESIKPETLLINKITDILIYGAGPIGLVTAIQIALYFPQKKIVIADLSRRFEQVNGIWKNLEFPKNQPRSRRRGQVVTIRDDCRDLFPFLKTIFQQRFKNRIWGGTSTNVPIRQIEDVLMEEVQSGKFSNIKLQLTKEGSQNIIQKLNQQKFDLVIGCDGSGSQVRQILAPSPSNQNLDPNCKIQGKRYVFGSDYVLGVLVNQNMKEYRELNQKMNENEKLQDYHALLTMTQMRLLLNAYYPPISNNDKQKGIQGFLNIRLSQQQFSQFFTAGNNKNIKCNFTDPAQIFGVSEKNFVQLNRDQKDAIQSAFNYYGLDVIENCGYIYFFQLKPAYASKFAFQYEKNNKEKIHIFLCGDAAISHHFWPGRGLNTGLKSVSFLLDCLCYPEEQSLRYYNQNMQRLAKRQIIQRSLNFCQINGKKEIIKSQLSLFDKQSLKPIGSNCKDLSLQQIETWSKSVQKRIQQLKEGSFRADNTRGIPAWPSLSVSKLNINSKLKTIAKRFWRDPRNARCICYSGRWYRQGTQPEVFSRNMINRIDFLQYQKLKNIHRSIEQNEVVTSSQIIFLSLKGFEYNGNRYQGNYQNGKMHGQGIYYYRNGDRYQGDFQNDKMHGQGIYYYKNGDIYQGKYQNDKKHGKGICYYKKGHRYQGNYQNGKMHGQGIYYYRNGDRQQGIFQNGKMHGQGIYYYENGDRYQGNYQNDKKHGKGICYYKKGDRYQGNYQNDKKHGKGIYYFQKGDRYQGDFQNGKKHGKGIYYYKKGDRYQGIFQNGKMHGQGIYYYKKGDRYQGNYQNDKKHGKGIYYYKKGDRYQKYFYNGKQTTVIRNKYL